jgi:glyoxylase-like metal-dependent hydrolase (beta-lactamase superfamily II)
MSFAKVIAWLLLFLAVVLWPIVSVPEINKAEQIAPDVYFHEGDLKGHGHCNNGWIIFEDYVLVIDGNFPSGAQEIIPKIKAITDKPVRFAFDTHHHGDHAYGNQVWVDNGAVPVAHTHGDGFAWLPKEKILFTGDACVNGPYNYVGDGDTEQWVKTLELAKQLGAKTICPGHGPMGTGQVLLDQQAYFVELRKQVKQYARKAPEQLRLMVDSMRAAVLKEKAIARFVGDSFPSQVEKVYIEMGGKPFQAKTAAIEEQKRHAHSHGFESAQTATTEGTNRR